MIILSLIHLVLFGLLFWSPSFVVLRAAPTTPSPRTPCRSWDSQWTQAEQMEIDDGYRWRDWRVKNENEIQNPGWSRYCPKLLFELGRWGEIESVWAMRFWGTVGYRIRPGTPRSAQTWSFALTASTASRGGPRPYRPYRPCQPHESQHCPNPTPITPIGPLQNVPELEWSLSNIAHAQSSKILIFWFWYSWLQIEMSELGLQGLKHYYCWIYIYIYILYYIIYRNIVSIASCCLQRESRRNLKLVLFSPMRCGFKMMESMSPWQGCSEARKLESGQVERLQRRLYAWNLIFRQSASRDQISWDPVAICVCCLFLRTYKSLEPWIAT